MTCLRMGRKTRPTLLFKFRFTLAITGFHVARVLDHSPLSISMVVSAVPNEVVDAKTSVEQHPVAG